MYRAIVVDDEPFMLEGMRLMIRWAECGFTLVGEAGTAEDALRMVDELRPELVITDIRMPGLWGTQLAEQLMSRRPETLLIFFSGYRDFAYAQAAIRTHVMGYLLKPIDPDEVHKALRRVRDTLDERGGKALPADREHLLRRLAFGDDSDEAMLGCGEALGVGEGDVVCCCVLEAEAQRHAAPQTVRCARFALSPRLTGAVLRGEPASEAFLALRDELMGPDAAAIGVGLPAAGARGFRQSLRQAMEALGPWYIPDGALRRFRPYEKELAAWLYEAEPITLAEAIRRSDERRAAELADRLEALYRARRPDMQYLRVMAKELEASLFEAGGGERRARLRRLWKDETLAGDAWMRDFRQCVGDLASARHEEESRTPAPVRQALRAIEERYADDLTIGGVAAELYTNPAYLGQLVRRHTGQTFHRHLLRVRMQHACRLLRQTAMPVGEVAKAVGVGDVDYFSAQFRKLMSMTPCAYRNAVSGEVSKL